MAEPMLLEMDGIVKTFPGVRALDGVHLDLKAGEVHALLGENGAGKSTLIKVLGGIYKRDGGEIVINSCVDQPCWSHLHGKSGVTESPRLRRTVDE